MVRVDLGITPNVTPDSAISTEPPRGAARGEHEAPSLAPSHNRSKLTTSRSGGKRLSAMQLPWFSALPPRGFGVLTTKGRKTGQPRRTCVRVVRDRRTAFLVAIAGERTD